MELTIRRMRPDDLASLHALLSDGEVMRFIEPVFTQEKTRLFLESSGLCPEPLILAVEDGAGFAGYVIYHRYDEDSMELGWVLSRAVWGRGYAQELTSRLAAMAHGMGKDAVIECAPEQDTTRHIALKAGFFYVGMNDGCCVFRRAAGERALQIS